jgi:hypothetical protein
VVSEIFLLLIALLLVIHKLSKGMKRNVQLISQEEEKMNSWEDQFNQHQALVWLISILLRPLLSIHKTIIKIMEMNQIMAVEGEAVEDCLLRLHTTNLLIIKHFNMVSKSLQFFSSFVE